MMWALQDGALTAATTGAKGTCPLCQSTVIGKQGDIVTAHWAHESREDCDPWSEPISEWHLSWQKLVPPRQREVVIGAHRADIVTAGGWIVEVQRSSIPPAEIEQREEFYGQRMLWVFDAYDAYDSDRLNIRSSRADRADPYRTFRWKHPRKSVAACRRRVILDLGDGQLFGLGRFYCDTAPYGGYGWMVDGRDFYRWLHRESRSAAAWPGVAA